MAKESRNRTHARHGRDRRRSGDAGAHRRPLQGRPETTSFVGSAIGAGLGTSEARASDVLSEGMAALLRRATGSSVDPGKLKGNLFEYIEAAEYNTNAARAGISVRAKVTADAGRPHDSADVIFVDDKGRILSRAQMKAGSNEYNTWALSDPKYASMQKLVPKDKVDSTRRMAIGNESNPNPTDPRDYGDTAERVQGELKYGDVSSGGTTTTELQNATQNPDRYASRRLLDQFGREAVDTGMKTAGASAVIGWALSAVRNGVAYSKGEIDGKQVVENITKDTVKAGVRGGATGALGVGIRYVAKLGGPKVLARSNVACAVAAWLIETGIAVYQYARGDISGQEAGERIGGTACGTVSNIGIAAVAGTVFGPIGSIVGGIAGYLLSSHVYQSCIAVFRNARLAEEDAERVVALSQQAVEAMRQQRRQIENRLAAYLDKRQERLDRYFDEIDHAILTKQPEDAVQALGGLVSASGLKPLFRDFQEFDRCMIDRKTLVI